MDFFTKSDCSRCQEYEKEVELLTLRNTRLEEALIELKNRYTSLKMELENEDEYEEQFQGLSQDEVDELFAKIKSSPYDNDKKRYFRSMLMMIKSSYNPSIHSYIKSQLN